MMQNVVTENTIFLPTKGLSFFFFKDKRLVAYEGRKINNPKIRHLISLVKKNKNLILHSHLTHTRKTCFASHQSALMGAV